MKYIHLCLLLVLVLGVMACGCTTLQSQPQTLPPTPVPTIPQTTVQTTPTTPAYPLQLSGYWVLQTMAIQDGSAPFVPTTEISLVLNADGSATGYTGCNNYFTSYTLTGITTPKGNSMVFGPITTSKKYCFATASQESNYLNVLQNTAAYAVNGNLLTLTDKSQNALVFQQSSTIVTTTYYPHPA
ncbi:META domain-containing protein [uncultured Methanoregula sp.]|uniref:META domain-containing protein n=1 Tax=uncultured Methanoregula sp. TaxID=1005933 RepID=UPI002AAB30EF|nr:META domain-containing protein [uncultured Methanoregula sp.]